VALYIFNTVTWWTGPGGWEGGLSGIISSILKYSVIKSFRTLCTLHIVNVIEHKFVKTKLTWAELPFLFSANTQVAFFALIFTKPGLVLPCQHPLAICACSYGAFYKG
jgi:hypothetical protein